MNNDIFYRCHKLFSVTRAKNFKTTFLKKKEKHQKNNSSNNFLCTSQKLLQNFSFIRHHYTSSGIKIINIKQTLSFFLMIEFLATRSSENDLNL